VKIGYSEQSIKDLKRFNAVERILVAKKIEYLAENFTLLKQTKKVRELKGTEFNGQYRLTVARKIRVIFRIESEEIIILILRIGKRKDIYNE